MQTKAFNKLVIIAALGYFVDIYDLILFNVVKKQSIMDLGFTEAQYKLHDITLFNMQMAGMLIGGLIWGVLGDKKGRVSVLFGSILMYSLANIANAFVTSLEMYGAMRFIAGVGLAGELGAGITLVAETMHKDKRGYGTMIIVSVGALGAVCAYLVGDNFSWKTAYIIGGGMGMLLLALRAGAFESGMFKQIQHHKAHNGNLMMLVNNKKRFMKYVACILIGLPVWFVVGVLINLSDRIVEAINPTMHIEVREAVMYSYIGLSFGDLLSGFFSQYFRSRKKVIVGYLVVLALTVAVYLSNSDINLPYLKFMWFLLGSATGFWALFVTNAAEQFGTNLRSTVTNTVPNFVRGAVVPITLSFKGLMENYGTIQAAVIVGSICLILSLIAILSVKETFSKDLDYVETL